MTKLLINDIIRMISFGVFGFVCADNGLTVKTAAFWILIACMIVNEITSMNHERLKA